MAVRKKNEIDYIAAFFVMAAYGSMGLFVRWAGLEGREQIVVFYRALFGFCLLALIVLLSGRARSLRVRECLLLNLVGGALWSLQSFSSIKALYLLPVKEASFIIYLAPVLLAILAPVVLREKLERTTLLALAVAVGGLAFLTFAQTGAEKPLNAAGVFYALLSAVCYASGVLVLKVVRRKLDVLTINVVQGLVPVLLFLPFALPVPRGVSAGGWGSLAVLGLFHGCLLAIAYVYVAKRVKAQHLGILSYIDPVSATVLALLFLQEKPLWQDYVGAALIVAAGVIVIVRGALQEGNDAGEIHGGP